MINNDDLIYLSKLAKIPIKNKDIKKFQEQISEIISFIDLLSEVDTTNVDPFFEVNDLSNIFRDDKECDIDFDKDIIGFNAISFDSDYFKIDKVL